MQVLCWFESHALYWLGFSFFDRSCQPKVFWYITTVGYLLVQVFLLGVIIYTFIDFSQSPNVSETGPRVCCRGDWGEVQDESGTCLKGKDLWQLIYFEP